MVTPTLFDTGIFSIIGLNSELLIGAKLYWFVAQTSTPATTYTTSALSIANPNPVPTDATGRFRPIWLGAGPYKYILQDVQGNVLRTIDNFTPVAAYLDDYIADAASTSGASLIGWISRYTSAIAGTVADYLDDRCSIMHFIPFVERMKIRLATSTADLSAYFLGAAASGDDVWLPKGTYHLNALTLPANSHFTGAGEGTILKAYDTSLRGILGCDSGSSSATLDNMSFRNFKFLSVGGFLETAHSLNLNGVRNVMVDNIQFIGARGDGFYLGSGIAGGAERHNYNVTVQDCFFDGMNNTNRNPISIIDVDGMTIDNNVFRRWGRSDMPGGVDFEPDDTFGVVRNVKHSRNTYSEGGGNRGHFTLSTLNATTSWGNIESWANTYYGSGAAAGGDGISINTPSTLATVPNFVDIHDETFYDCRRIIVNEIGSIYGLSMTRLKSYATTAGYGRILIGDNTTLTWTSKDVTLEDSKIIAPTSIIFSITNNSEDVFVVNNRLSGPTQAHLQAGRSGTSTTNWTVTGNRFLGSPSNGAAQHEATTKNPATHIWRDNWQPVGVGHLFVAANTDFTGTIVNPAGIDETTNPAVWPGGDSMCRLSGRTIYGASQSGTLYTHRPSSDVVSANGYVFIHQEFVPDYSASYKTKRYFREAIDATTWDAWYELTGA